MSSELDLRLRALDLDGTPLWDVDSPVGAYEIVDYDEPGITWRRQRVTSPFVDGTVEAGATRDANSIALVVRVKGADGEQINVRRAAMTDAMTANPWWLLEVTLAGVRSVWRANRADWATSTDPFELMATPPRRVLTLTIPVQPSRAVSYL